MELIIINQKEIIRSCLPYQGHKTNLLPQLLEYFPKNINNFIEPFGGGCNVGINVNCNKILYNDIIPEVVGLFKYLKNNNYDNIITYLESTIKKEELNNKNKKAFLNFRKKYNNTRYLKRNPLDFYLLVTQGFNNYIIFNRHQYMNAYGYRTFNDNLKRRLKIFHEKINKLDIEFYNMNIFNNEFNKTIKPMAGDYVYCDPPYSISKAAYNSGWISERDDRKLCNILDDYNKQGIKWGQSNFLSYENKTNKILMSWLEKNNYKLYDIESKYYDRNTINNQREVFITNVK
jgi:DNA adenine methylase Dam